MRKVAGIALIALSIGAGSAQASTVVESGNPIYQQWIDKALVPTPDMTLSVVDAICPMPGAEEKSCTGFEWFEVYMNPMRERQRYEFFHELGHNFDYYALTDAQRGAYAYFRGKLGWHKEAFAETYALCATRRTIRPDVDYLPIGFTKREHYRFCEML